MCDSPVKDEDDDDQQEGQQISENPHQVILVRSLRNREQRSLSVPYALFGAVKTNAVE